MPIETERLVIRAFHPELDSTEMAAVYTDPEVMRYIPGGALAGVDEVKALLESYADAQIARGFSSWGVVDRATRQLIGDVGFGVFEPTGDIELGYTLARSAWGVGYATEAARACLVAGLEHLAPRRIVAAIDVDNDASIRVAERLRMTRGETVEAHGRPHVLFVAQPL